MEVGVGECKMGLKSAKNVSRLTKTPVFLLLSKGIVWQNGMTTVICPLTYSRL